MGLERSTTASSMASSFAGSSAGGDGQSENGEHVDEDQELLQKQATIEDGIFGVLYTLSKEKATTSFRSGLFKLFVDFAQLVVFYVDPAFGWAFSYDTLYNVLYNFQLQNPLKDIGYAAWFGTFCILAIILGGSVGLCAYVAQNFKTGRFPHVWPIKLLRIFVAVFFTLFYVSALGIFIISFDCNVTGGLNTAYNRKFPERKCMNAENLPTGIVGLTLSFTFTGIAYFMEQADSDQNPLFNDPMGQPTSSVSVRNMLGKTAVSVLWIVLIDSSKGFLALVMMCITWFLWFDIVRNLPYYFQVMNYVRSGFYSLLAWFSLLNLLMVYHESAIEKNVFLFVLGTPAALAVGLGVVYLRMRRIKKIQNMFLLAAQEALENNEEAKVEAIVPNIDHEFWDPVEVELASRVIRAKLKYQTRRRSRKLQLSKKEEMALHLACQAALLVGLEQFPEETYLQILYGNFLISISKDSALGYSFLERARAQHTSFQERLMIFTKDRERTQQLGDDSGAAKMDLVRYVEFQNSFTLIKKTHQFALKSTRRFWRILLHNNVSFGSLSTAFKDMDTAESKGDRTYKVMIERYPKSSKLLRSYGHFLEDIRNDPWRAQRYFNEADKIDEEASYEVGSMAGSDNSDDFPTDVSHVDDKKFAVVVIKPNGVIRIANPKTEKLFGYKSGELIGKNVNILMPQPYSQQHNGYLKKFMATGKQSILNMKQKLQGRHKKGHVFPINLLVSKVPGGPSENDVNFMDDEGVGIVSMNKHGIINAFNVACEQIFGLTSSEAPGKPFKKLLEKASIKPFEEAMGLAMASVGENMERQVQAMNKEGNSFPISVTLVAEASGGFIVKIQSLDDVMGMITIDDVGQIKNANEFVAQMFGHSMAELTTKNVSELMPRPYSMFHPSYLKRYKNTKKSNILDDPLGRTVNGLHKSGHLFPIHLQVYNIENTDGSNEVLYSGRIMLPKSNADDARGARCTIRDDGEVLQLAEHFEPLYGVNPQAYSGKPMSDLVSELEPSEGSDLVAAINALEPMQSKNPTRQISKLSSVSRDSSRDGRSSGKNLSLEEGTQDGQHRHPGGLSARGVLHFSGTPILVFMTTEATMVPRTKVIQMWAGHLMEGVIDITKAGIISEATFGIQILFGYHEDELVGQNVSMLMPWSVARHHDMFLQRYQEGERRNLIGVRRIVNGVHRDGSPLRLALEVCDTDNGSHVSTHRGERAAFTARVVLSNEPASPTPPEVNAADDEGAAPRMSVSGGGCAFAPAAVSSMTDARLPALKENPLASLAEVDEKFPVEADGPPAWSGPVTEAFKGESLSPERKSAAGGCPFGFGGGKKSDGRDGGAGASSSQSKPEMVNQGGGCPFKSSGGVGTLPLALQAQQRGRGGGCPFMSAETMDPGEANAFLKAQGCDVGDGDEAFVGGGDGGGPGPVCENYENAPELAVDPAALAAAAAAAASPSLPARGDAPIPRSKLVRFLTPQQLLAMEEAEHEAGVDEPTEEEAAYFQQQQLYAAAAAAVPEKQSYGAEPYHAQPDQPGYPGYEYYGNGTGAPPAAGGVGGDFAPVAMPAPLPQDPYYTKQALQIPRMAAGSGEGPGSDQTVDAEEEAADAAERRKAKMKKEVNKAKKSRRISKLLSSPEARKAMERLKLHTKLVMGTLLVLYVLAFTVMQIFAQEHMDVILKVETVSKLATAVPIAVIDARILEAAQRGAINASSSVVQEEMLREANILEDLGRAIYLGEGELAPPGPSVKEHFEAKTFVVEEWIDAEPFRFELVTTSLWDATKMYYQNVRRVVHEAENGVALNGKREWRYIIRNGAERMMVAFDKVLDSQTEAAKTDRLKVESVLIAVLCLNMALFAVVCIHFWRLLHKVSAERLGLYTVFVSIPRPIVMKLATKKITTGDEDNSDDGSDDEDAVMVKLKKEQEHDEETLALDDAPMPGVRGGILARNSTAPGQSRRASVDQQRYGQQNLLKGAPPPHQGGGGHDAEHPNEGSTARGSVLGRFRAVASVLKLIGAMRSSPNTHGVNQVAPEHQQQMTSSIRYAKTGRKIDPKGSNLTSFLIPLSLWGVISVVAFGLSFWQFEQTGDPTRSLAVSAHIEVLASTARFYANDLVLANTPGHVPTSNRTVDGEIAYLRDRLHNVTEHMYELYENLLLGGGEYELKGSLYTSPKHEPLLFNRGCLRLPGEHFGPPCVGFEHDYYYRTTYGLDNLIKHYREECLLLALEPKEALTPNNERYQFIWEAGKNDLRGGLRTNTHLYIEAVKVPPKRDQIIQISSLVLIIVAEAYCLRYMFFPWFRRTQTESHRIAELLAQLPAEIDMQAVIADQLLMKREEDFDFNK